MTKYYLKIAMRSIFRGKWMHSINIVGLSISLAVVILFSAYIFSELHRGSSTPDKENIFQLKTEDGITFSSPMIKMIREQVPDVNAITGCHDIWSYEKQFEVNQKNYTCENYLFTDSCFFDVFKEKVVYGNLDNALSIPNSIVLTKSESHKFFGSTNPIGEIINLKTTDFGNFNLVVKAVIEDLPKNSVFHYNGLISKYSLYKFDWYKNGQNHWGNENYNSFLKLNNDSVNQIVSEINKVFRNTAPDWIQKDKKPFDITAFNELYFSENTRWGDLVQHNSLNLIKTLALIALIILLISWINFINLSTSQNDKNQKVYSINKHLGASWKRLSIIGMINSIPVTLIAFAISIILIILILPIFNNLLDTKFQLSDLFTASNGLHTLVILSVSLIICGFTPVLIQRIRNKTVKKGKPQFRNYLLTFQFFISILFIFCTIVMIRQNKYMQQAPKGYYTNNIIHLNLLEQFPEQREAFRNEIMKIPGIQDVTFASDLICNINQPWGMSLKNEGKTERIAYTALEVDKNFFDFFGLKIIKGKGFGDQAISEKQHIFNQTAIKNFGIKNLNDAFITSYSNARGDILGEVEDFNFKSLHSGISNLGFLCNKLSNLSYSYIKSNANSSAVLKQQINQIEKIWKEFAPDWPIKYGFLDQSIQHLYDRDIRLNKAFSIAAIISIFIACIGLLGVSYYNIDRRTKEIGVRKVNGAKILEVMHLLNKDFAKWVVVAFIIATPLAWFIMHKWLENFAYKATISWWIFALSGIIALVISLITVSWQSWKAAIRNPVEALRDE